MWKANKAWFLDSTGTLICEYPTPVIFDLDDESRKSKVDEFIDWVYREYGEDMYSFFKDNYDGILDNKLTQPYGDFPRGMRLSKVLMKEFGLNAEDVRQKLSMLIQSNKVTGTLCLSVHPLDYLSASENNHGWRSCHALDGEYRAGNISYMLDNCTIIAYLKSSNGDTKLPRFPDSVPWNDKKWRVYLHVDRDNKVVYAGRQYPFHTDRGLELISEMIRKTWYFKTELQRQTAVKEANDVLSCPITESDYMDRYIEPRRFHHYGLKGTTVINGETMEFSETKFIVAGDRWGESAKIVPAKNYIQNDPDALNFNDVIQSHTYSPWYMTYNERMGGSYLPQTPDKLFIVGAKVPCVCCGNRLAHDSDTLLCSRCHNTDDEIECEHCGQLWPADEMSWVDGHGYICPDCMRDI